jgi:hypothetical protein
MEESGALALEVANVGGVFVLLIVGALFAILLACCEMVFDVHQRSRELKVPVFTLSYCQRQPLAYPPIFPSAHLLKPRGCPVLSMNLNPCLIYSKK